MCEIFIAGAKKSKAASAQYSWNSFHTSSGLNHHLL